MEAARVLWNGELQLLACCSQATQVMYGRHTAVGSTWRERNKTIKLQLYLHSSIYLFIGTAVGMVIAMYCGN